MFAGCFKGGDRQGVVFDGLSGAGAIVLSCSPKSTPKKAGSR